MNSLQLFSSSSVTLQLFYSLLLFNSAALVFVQNLYFPTTQSLRLYL
ncbi:hypothetical protein LINPERPRIM_LOCUS7456 [Linum perenne]